MPKLFLYNTLTRRKEEFKPLKKHQVGLYTCGPTVYNYAHLGNLRTYLFEDGLRRVLEYNNYKVKHVMNITDVGHLTGDMDMGEDKIETGATREGKSAWDIAEFYAAAFREDLAALNILEPKTWCKATDNISEQIALIEKLEKKGYTYQTGDGIYFNTAKVKDYNKLSHVPLDELREGARVEKNPEKKNPTDFALWKFSPAVDGGQKRQMEWDSPWGVGFPGWHIECSAMSLKYLKNHLDIHCGGVDHINIHHTNEIAQSEAATGKPFFNYWLHGAFLMITGGKKMAKSSGNFLTLKNALTANGLNPLVYRFSTLQTHYHKPLDYSEKSLKQAAEGFNGLLGQIIVLQAELKRSSICARNKGAVASEFKDRFLTAINDDLNLPKGLAVAFEVLKSSLSPADKLATIFDFDQVLGLRLVEAEKILGSVDVKPRDWPADVQILVKARRAARAANNWTEADRLRTEIEKAGYIVEDNKDDCRLIRK